MLSGMVLMVCSVKKKNYICSKSQILHSLAFDLFIVPLTDDQKVLEAQMVF